MATPALHSDYRRFLSKSGESVLSDVISTLLMQGHGDAFVFEGNFPPVLTAIREFKVPLGRADFVTIHEDGTMVVTEVKDGSAGLHSVLAGVGQVLAYAVQAGIAKGAVKQVKTALIFSTLRTELQNNVVAAACEMAGVVPILFGRPESYQKCASTFADDLAALMRADHDD